MFSSVPQASVPYVFLAVLLLGGSGSPRPIATVTTISGSVALHRAEKPAQAIVLGEPIYARDRLVVSDNARVTLCFGDARASD
jgi:hypothetical protein